MANDLITPQVITREALRLLENMFVAANTVSRAQEDDFRKIGQDLYVRKPVRFVTNSGKTAVIQDVEEAWQIVRVKAQENVAWKFDSRDLTLTVEKYSERYIKPAVSALCHEIELDIHRQYKKAYHSAVPAAGIGNHPASFIDLGQCRTLLSDHAAPYGERSSLLGTDACLNLANEVAGFANAYGVDRKAEKAQEEATIGRFVGFSNMESQFVVRHTAGVLDGGASIAIDGATTGTTYALAKNNTDPDLSWTQTIHVDGAGSNVAGWALEGDVITIEDCYSVNPATKASTGKLQQFVIRADATTATNETDLVISPPIITSGPHQTVEFAAGVTDLDGKQVTPISTGGQVTSQNLAYHKEAITFGMIPLEMPDSVVWGNTQTDNGMSIRVYKYLDGDADEEKIRLDAMWFVEVVHPDLIARLWGG